MEGGDAQILPPRGIVKMPIEREEGMVRIKVNGIVLQAHNITGGGGCLFTNHVFGKPGRTPPSAFHQHWRA